ncbi:MAG: hypothetical protein ACYC43_12015 [Burkholderiales bacterium]
MEKLILVLAFSAVFAIGAGVVALSLSRFSTEECRYYIVDSLSSPMGNMYFVRTIKYCTNDDETERPMMFALLRSGAKFDMRNVFLTSADYEGIHTPLSIFPKWIDDHNLLIAAPEGSKLKTLRSELDGIHIQYAYYPIDSNKTKNEYLRRQVEKKVHFESKFSIDHGIGVPGIGCNLTVSAHDGEHLDELNLNMTARTTFAVKVLQPPDYRKTVLEEAYSAYDFQIYDRDEVERPDKHATAADVVGFEPKYGRSMLEMIDFNYPRTIAPSGAIAPKWSFGYNPKDPHDIVAIAEKIKGGTFAIRVGYWMDNEVVVYSGGMPDDPKPIVMFEQCINENHIFDTPRL